MYFSDFQMNETPIPLVCFAFFFLFTGSTSKNSTTGTKSNKTDFELRKFVTIFKFHTEY